MRNLSLPMTHQHHGYTAIQKCIISAAVKCDCACQGLCKGSISTSDAIFLVSWLDVNDNCEVKPIAGPDNVELSAA